MDYNIPIVDEEVSTDDGSEGVAMPILGGIMGFLTLFGIVGASSFAYGRVKEVAGVDGETEIPGV